MNMIHPTDAELVSAALKGSRESFGTLIERHQQFVCALAYSKTGSVAGSEDIAQETFLSAWKNLAALRAPENFRGWLCGTVRHLAAKFHGRQKSSIPLTDDVSMAPPPSEEIMTREEEAMLWATLEQLPGTYRESLVLFHRGGLSVREISAALEISEDAVKQRLSRGRAMLQDAVRARVESALTHSRPGKAFTLAVLAGLPAVTTSAQAAAVGVAAAKGGGMAGTTTLAALAGPLSGVLMGGLGAWVGYKGSLVAAESEAERKLIKRAAAKGGGMFIAYMLLLGAMIWFGRPMIHANGALWGGLLAAVILTFSVGMVVFALHTRSRIQHIRRSERIRNGLQPDQPLKRGGATEYRSRATFLGLPLIHFCGSRPDGGIRVAKGWIAIGAVAVSPFLAIGGIAVGGFALGGVGLGLFCFAGIGLGLVTFCGFAAGWLAMGGFAAGYVAIGGFAWAWRFALGGQVYAREYAIGGHAHALHANDAAARSVLQGDGIVGAMHWLTQNVVWIEILFVLPLVLILFCFQSRLQKRRRAMDGAEA